MNQWVRDVPYKPLRYAAFVGPIQPLPPFSAFASEEVHCRNVGARHMRIKISWVRVLDILSPLFVRMNEALHGIVADIHTHD